MDQSFVKSMLRRYRGELGLVIAIMAVIAVTSVLDGSHSYWNRPAYNATEILRQTSVLGIFALGATVVIISGGIDLSSGAVMAFSGAICASIILSLAPHNDRGIPITNHLPMWIILVSITGTLLCSLLVGSFHAWLITAVGLPPFVATLASLVGLRSLARVLVQDVNGAFSGQGRNTQIYVDDPTFRALGKEWWIALLVFVVMAIIIWVLLSRTVVGRHLYAMGGNEQAARLSGIRTERLKWLSYCIGSLTAAIAGVLHLAYVSLSNPASAAMGYELNAIAASVVGGCSLTGGIGTIPGTMLGALFLRTVIDSVSKTVKTTPDDFEGLIVGVLVVLAVTFNELRSRGGLKKQFFPGGLGFVSWFILTLLAGVVSMTMATTSKVATGLTVGGATFLLLGARLYFERRAAGTSSAK